MGPDHADDVGWLARTEQMLLTVPPAAMGDFERQLLTDLVDDAILMTTRSNEIQLGLASLHHAYDIGDILGPGRSNLTVAATGLQPPAAMRQPPSSSSTPQPPAGIHQAPTLAPSATPAIGTQGSGPVSTVPNFPGVTGQKTEHRDRQWKFQCHRCTHLVRYRAEFNRHVNDATGDILGFKIVHANPPADMTWYALDAQGNQYSGNIVPESQGQPSGRSRIPDPCGPPIRAKIKAKGKKTKGKKTKGKKTKVGPEED
ncbi:hypothetical protein A1O1_07968 [Capronia coronata CBS 617.96]|uniref:Uncharacterized protein n=1 Tax=Capronia coronata CBS 617.96 TaxID=1182541 RepID=W9XY87_9EURO|nr:uncharacterized protein A1O1_07968 [Capronia coronata CBS 617.96]EXJ81901.1 hypothetical protein A1O1_07968 [Capronia coronata CBS 617.96]